MNTDLIAIMIPIIAIIGGVIMIILIRRYEYLEKVKMIENGIDPSNLKRIKNATGWGASRFAFTIIGVGLGIIIANILDTAGMEDDIAYPAMILVMGGIGLLVGTHYSKALEKKEKDL